jgi:hypothetical protein
MTPGPDPRRAGPALVEGAAARATLADALEHVAALVPYLTATIDPPGSAGTDAPTDPTRPLPTDGEWVPCRTLIDDDAWLGRIIRSTGSGLGTEDPVVAASLFVQSYSYRILTLTVGCLTATGVVPDASASHMAVGLARHWPSLVAFLDPAVLSVGTGTGTGTDGAAVLRTDRDAADIALQFVIDNAVEDHLRPLLGAVTTGIGVPLGQRLLWGNVAASAAVAFRTMEGCLGPWVEDLGERFFALAPASLQGLGSYCVVENGDRHGWFWERTSCCLFDRLPDGVRCADCSLTPESERRAAYRASLDLG